MLNFVDAVTHKLLGNHAGRHVPADAQPELVGFVDDHGNEFGFDRAVDLDLHVPELGVIIDTLARLLWRGRQHLHRSFVGAGTVDESRQHNARADLFALFDMLLEFPEVLNRVGQIARCRDARGDIENR